MALKVEDNQNLSTKNQKTTKSKKRRKAAETLVHFVLDETGSMSGVRDATIDGFNEYVNGLRADKKGKYWMSLTKFDTRAIVPVYTDLPIKEVPDLDRDTYNPCAMTNLNDAIGESITKMEDVVAKRKKKCNVLIVVMTDGHENQSKEWTADMVKKLIQKKEKVGWTVTFLGANMDAQKVGRTYAIKSGNAKTYSTQNMGETMRGMAGATVMYAASATVGASSDNFFEGTGDWTDGNSQVGDTVDPTKTSAASTDLSNLSSLTVTDVGDMGLVYDRTTGQYSNVGGFVENTTAPADKTGLSNRIKTNVFNPPSKKTLFDSIDPKLLDEAEDRFRDSGTVIKPLDDDKEDTNNG